MMKKKNKIQVVLMIAVATLGVVLLPACDKINNESLPNYGVHINLGTYGSWNTYGVHSLGDYRIFNRAKRIPANFPYSVNTYTGFGGVLLFMGQDMTSGGATPLAFDLACPVEHDANVTVTIDPSSLDAVCNTCNSHYDVLIGGGGPKSGMALDRRVGLNPYKVYASSSGGYVISNY